MTSLVIYETIHATIADEFSPEERPAEYAYLMERYASQPEPTSELVEETERAFRIIARIEERNLYLPPMEAAAAGVQQFIEEFTETLHADAGEVFAES